MPTPIRRVKRREPIRTLGVETEESVHVPIKAEDAQPGHLFSPRQLTPVPTPEPATPQKKRKVDLDNERPETPHSGPQLLTPPSTPTAFGLSKALFQRGSQTREVVGRADERKRIVSFISEKVQNSMGGVLYVSGLPGTGKTALITDTLRRYRNVPIGHLNCMSVDKPEQIFTHIAKTFKHLGAQNTAISSDRALELLRKQLVRGGAYPCSILVLDELDHIVTANQEVIFKLFELACSESSSLIILGIANAIDLTDRFLPRLQTHKLVPELLQFKPYDTDAIHKIIETRLRSLRPTDEDVPVMEQAAIRMCASKTAANSGDLRKAFDICRRSIELMEEKYRATHGNVPLYEVSQIPKVNLQTVLRVCKEAFGGINALERVTTLNFQQRAVLAVLVVTESKHASNLTINQIHEEYSRRSEALTSLSPLIYPEFLQVVGALEASGVISVTGVCSRKGLGSGTVSRSSRGGGGASGSRASDGHKEAYGLRKISSKVQLMDVITALSKDEPLKALLLTALT